MHEEYNSIMKIAHNNQLWICHNKTWSTFT